MKIQMRLAEMGKWSIFIENRKTHNEEKRTVGVSCSYAYGRGALP